MPRRTLNEHEALYIKSIVHENALLELGFLAKRDVPAYQTKWGEVLRQINSQAGVSKYANGRLRGLRPGIGSQRENTNVYIELTAPANDLTKWEGLIRQSALPEPGK